MCKREYAPISTDFMLCRCRGLTAWAAPGVKSHHEQEQPHGVQVGQAGGQVQLHGPVAAGLFEERLVSVEERTCRAGGLGIERCPERSSWTR
jgi:hypothetical protein